MFLRKKAQDLPKFFRLRQNHAGYVVSSYSRMKRVESGELDPLERDEFRREPGQKTLETVLTEEELPGGTATGTMLHEILENIPFDSLASKPALEDWLGRDAVKQVFDVAMARSGIIATAGQRRRAGEMIYRALTMTIPLGSERSTSGHTRMQTLLIRDGVLVPFPGGFPSFALGTSARQARNRAGISKGSSTWSFFIRAGFISRTGRAMSCRRMNPTGSSRMLVLTMRRRSSFIRSRL